MRIGNRLQGPTSGYQLVRPGRDGSYHTWVNGKSGVTLYILARDRSETKRIFDLLYAARSEIESAFGEPLQWKRLDRKNCLKNSTRVQRKF